MMKRERELRRVAAAFGLRVERGGKHYRLVGADGGLVAAYSASSSDWRAMKNLKSELKGRT